MYEKKNVTYVLTILEAIEKIYIYTRGIQTAEVFYEQNDQLEFNACQTLLLVIGEESKKIDENLKSEHQKIPWNLISGMRNRIAHDYRSIDPNITFDIVRNYLPPLKSALILMLEKIDFEEDFLRRIVDTNFYRHLKYLVK
ncbi:MAG: hypothetical protein Sapg2KO_15400 [Saprospiraceae bacterium]